MRLLFDENLSQSLCERLVDIFPDCEHVCAAGLERAFDIEIWTYAKEKGLTIVTRDSDFHQLSFLHGAPPKVVWLRLGNCTTDQVENALRRGTEALSLFDKDVEGALLVIGGD